MAFQYQMRAAVRLNRPGKDQTDEALDRLSVRASHAAIRSPNWPGFDPTKDIYFPPRIDPNSALASAGAFRNYWRKLFVDPSIVAPPPLHHGLARNSHRREGYVSPPIAAPLPPIRQAIPQKDRHGEHGTPKQSDYFTKRYSTGKVLGKGGQGCAKLGYCNETRQIVAIKKIQKYQYSSHMNYINSQILAAKHHPNIIKLIEISTFRNGTGTGARMALEFCNGGNIDEFCERFLSRKESIPEPYILYIFREIAKALAFLHSGYGSTKRVRDWVGIIHRDVKPENIMIHHSRRAPHGLPQIKLIDFDCACTEDCHFSGHCAGTEDWFPPEVSNSHPSADVWSLSAVIFHLSGCKPSVYEWPEANSLGKTKRPPPFDMLTRGYSKSLDQMVRRGLSSHPQDRPTAVRLVKDLSKMHIDRSIKKFQAWMAVRSWVWIDNTPEKREEYAQTPCSATRRRTR